MHAKQQKCKMLANTETKVYAAFQLHTALCMHEVCPKLHNQCMQNAHAYNIPKRKATCPTQCAHKESKQNGMPKCTQKAQNKTAHAFCMRNVGPRCSKIHALYRQTASRHSSDIACMNYANHTNASVCRMPSGTQPGACI